MIGKTFGLSALFFAILIGLALLSNEISGQQDELFPPALVAVALVPFVILLVLSGKLEKFTGFGLELSLRGEAKKPVTAASAESIIDVESEDRLVKGHVVDLPERIQSVKPTTLEFRVGQSGFYSEPAILEYCETMAELADFRYVLFNSPEGNFAGYMEAEEFIELVRGPTSIVTELESGRILNRRGVVTARVQQGQSYRDALRLMEAHRVEHLAVVDETNKFVGSISQDQIVRKILASIITQA